MAPHTWKPVEPIRQAPVDTPELFGCEWTDTCGGPGMPLGRLKDPNKSIVIVGAGIAGLELGNALLTAGAKNVTILESRKEVGGRFRSVELGEGTHADDGIMRPPRTATLFGQLAEQYGFKFLDPFPNPGTVPTKIHYQGKSVTWTDPKVAPEGFETVHRGWGSFVNEGTTIDGMKLTPLETINTLLRQEAREERMKAVQHWQTNLDFAGRVGNYDIMMRKIFMRDDAPGGTRWTEDDMSRYEVLGIGTGPFLRAFGQLSALNPLRWVANACETDQCTLGKEAEDGSFKPVPFADLPKAMARSFIDMGGKLRLDTPVNDIKPGFGEVPDKILLHKPDNGMAVWESFDVAVLTVPNTVVLTFKRYMASLPARIREAIENHHQVASTKISWKTMRASFDADGSLARVVVTDNNTVPTAYLLDYGHPEYLVMICPYAWEQGSHLSAMTEDRRQWSNIKNALITTAGLKWTKLVEPVGDVHIHHWQEDRNALGAFPFVLPNEVPNSKVMYFDALRLGSSARDAARPIHIGDTTGFDCWAEDAVRSSRNALNTILHLYGEVFHPEVSPRKLLHPDTYTYSVPPPTSTED